MQDLTAEIYQHFEYPEEEANGKRIKKDELF